MTAFAKISGETGERRFGKSSTEASMETLSRTIGTSLALFLAIAPLAVFGGSGAEGIRVNTSVRLGACHKLVDLYCSSDPSQSG